MGYATAAHPGCEPTKVLFAYDFGIEQAGSALLSRCTDLFQAVDPNNPEQFRSSSEQFPLQFNDRKDSLVTESAPVKTKIPHILKYIAFENRGNQFNKNKFSDVIICCYSLIYVTVDCAVFLVIDRMNNQKT